MKRLQISEKDNFKWNEEFELYDGENKLGIFSPTDKFFDIVPVADLISTKESDKKLKYFIPAFQRGYRWDELQVQQLISDVRDFFSDPNNNKYCLQPIVLNKSSNKEFNYDIIDGQQRLTTIYIILKSLGIDPEFEIHYQTREESKNFLAEIKSKTDEDAQKNIDYYHMFNAFKTAKECLNEFDEDSKNIFDKNLINNCVFIRYELQNESESEKIFQRINAGKIPLNNAELIKARLLGSNNPKIGEIGLEWDQIELKLRDNAFWYWLGEEETDSPHIDKLFRTLAKCGKQSSSTYEYINKKIKNEGTEKVWSEVFSLFSHLQTWFDDYEIYHLIGYMTAHQGKKDFITTLYEVFQSDDYPNNLVEIQKYLKDEIEKDLLKNYICEDGLGGLLDKLVISDNKCRNLLLLINIITCIKSNENNNNKDLGIKYIRFPFDIYKTEKWDIEHIYPNSEIESATTTQNEELIGRIKEYYNDCVNKDICDKLDEFNESICQDSMQFNNKYQELLKLINGTDDTLDDINHISNLCLLDRSTNRGYGNNPFPLKRQTIIENDASLKFIPICTKNVFTKYYSNNSLNLLSWTQEDANGYLDKIGNILNDFFKKEENAE